MRTKERNIVLVVLLLLTLTASVANAYTGSLTSADGGLLGTGAWVDQTLAPPDGPPWTPATIVWVVTQNPDSTWHYDYVLSVYRQDVSHAIIEVSEAFVDDDLLNPSGPYETVDVDWQDPGSGSPGMPAPIYGIKFDSTWGTTVHFSFDSTRQPVWGDFYAKDGQVGTEWNAVWNAGFTNPDNDPTAPPSDGSVDCHLLVPDTLIPEPTGLLALFCGFAGLSGMIVRRRR